MTNPKLTPAEAHDFAVEMLGEVLHHGDWFDGEIEQLSPRLEPGDEAWMWEGIFKDVDGRREGFSFIDFDPSTVEYTPDIDVYPARFVNPSRRSARSPRPGRPALNDWYRVVVPSKFGRTAAPAGVFRGRHSAQRAFDRWRWESTAARDAALIVGPFATRKDAKASTYRRRVAKLSTRSFRASNPGDPDLNQALDEHRALSLFNLSLRKVPEFTNVRLSHDSEYRHPESGKPLLDEITFAAPTGKVQVTALDRDEVLVDFEGEPLSEVYVGMGTAAEQVRLLIEAANPPPATQSELRKILDIVRNSDSRFSDAYIEYDHVESRATGAFWSREVAIWPSRVSPSEVIVKQKLVDSGHLVTRWEDVLGVHVELRDLPNYLAALTS